MFPPLTRFISQNLTKLIAWHRPQTTIKLLGSGIFLLIMVFVAPTSLLPYYAQASMSNVGYIVFWIVAHFLVNGKAVTTLAAFNTVPKAADSTVSNSAGPRSGLSNSMGAPTPTASAATGRGF